MRIAFISYDFPEYCIRHANVMSVENEVLLMLPSNGVEEHVHLLEPKVRYESFHRPRYRQPLRQLATMLRILRKVRAFNPDVVHFQNGHLFFNLCLSLLRRFPLVITIHDPRQHLGDRESQLTPQFLMDYGFRSADRVIVHGTDLKPLVVQRLSIDENQVHIIPHVAIGEREIDTPLTDDGNTILFFGRIWEYKGLEYLIRAEPKISAEFPNLRIVIGGQGEDFSRYRQSMSHPERFEIHNHWISEDQRARMFAGASVVVLPYVEATQSGVIPMAYSYEKPVIATRTGGLPDMVEHGETGLLVPPRDSDALAQAIVELLRDKQKRVAMGRAGKEKLVRECSPEVVARQTLTVYQETIDGRRLGHKSRRSASESTRRSGFWPRSSVRFVSPLATQARRRVRRSSETLSVQTPLTEPTFPEAATRIHRFIADRHLVEGAMIGPDPGVRFNYRFWRFFKSYLPNVNWDDGLYYLQGQGYWILANWMLSQSEHNEYERLALAATEQVLKRQRDDGAWDYPNPEWKGRVATVEGIWASLGLLESYRRSGATSYLDAAVRWHAFFESKIGYQEFDGKIAANYFADVVEAPVPNNSALALRFLAKMADATGDSTYLNLCDGLLHFISEAQLPSGEVPYVYGNPRSVHFQCFQYQAFLYLDVLEYYRVTGNPRAKEVLLRILAFLDTGIAPEGFAYYECGQRRRTVNYHTGAVAAALASARELDVPGHEAIADRAFRYLVQQLREDGTVPHSRGDYGVLSDRRAYPRYLAMMVFHLVSQSQNSRMAPVGRSTSASLARIASEGAF